MREEELRQAAHMYALVAEMEATKANIEGMRAANMQREACGDAMAYSEDHFQGAANDLAAIADRLRVI